MISQNKIYEEIESIRNVCPLDVYTLELAWSEISKRSELNTNPIEVVLVFENGNFTLYCDNAAWQESALNILTKLKDSPGLIQDLKERSAKYIRKEQEMYKWLIEGRYPSLLEAHKKVQDILHECIYSFAEENVTSLHSNILFDELNKLIPTQEKITALLNPKEMSSFQEYDIALLEIAAELYDAGVSQEQIEYDQLSEDIRIRIEALLKEFSWITAGWNDKPKDTKNVISELQEIFSTSVSPHTIKKEQKDRFGRALLERINAETSLKTELNQRDFATITLIQDLLDQGKSRIEWGLKIIYASRKIYELIASERDFPLIDLKFLTPDEVTKLLEGSVPPSNLKKIAAERRDKKLIISMKGGVVTYPTDFDTKSKKRADKILSGQVAYGGLVQGRVKIVNSPSENSKVFVGDILVSSRTSPELVPAMQKAAAIISELGGLLCHAAIISRELKTPCIVGVKGATEVLKDGDLVEVDADNGVVKIL